MKKYIPGVVLIILFIAGSIVLVTNYSLNIAINRGLPSPEYQLLCSPEGKYSLLLPLNKRGGQFNSGNVWNTKIKAIDFAWFWEEKREKPYVREVDKYEWEVCDK